MLLPAVFNVLVFLGLKDRKGQNGKTEKLLMRL